MRSMTIAIGSGVAVTIIVRIVVVLTEIPTNPVINLAISIIVHSVGSQCSRFTWVSPEVGGEIGMIQIHTGINDRNNDVGAAGLGVPRFWTSDPLLAPKRTPVWIIWNGRWCMNIDA